MQIRTKLPANEGAYSSSNPVICVPLVVRTSDFFVSDAHLGAPDAASSRLRELQLVAWLRTVGPHARSLYLVGDLFDFWFEYRHAVPKGYVRLLGALAELADQGVEIHLFRGNHDLWYGDYLTQEVGLQLHTERVRVVTRVHRHRACVAVFGQAQSFGSQCLKRRTARQHVDRLICQRELRAKIAADSAGAHDANACHVIRFGKKDRCGRWCG